MTESLRSLAIWLAAWLRRLLDPAADPRESFAYTYERQQALLIRVQQAMANITPARERLEAKTAELAATLPGFEAQARQALLAGREDRARLALQQRQVALVELEALEAHGQSMAAEEQRLVLVEQRLAAQIEAIFVRQQTIAARYNAAEAQAGIHRALRDVHRDLSEMDADLENAERRTDRLEARSEWLESLVETDMILSPAAGHPGTAERQAARAVLDAQVEERLEALKRELAT